jgi:hypothetical protein
MNYQMKASLIRCKKYAFVPLPFCTSYYFKKYKRLRRFSPYVVTIHENGRIMRTTNPHTYNLSLIRVSYLTTISVAKVI